MNPRTWRLLAAIQVTLAGGVGAQAPAGASPLDAPGLRDYVRAVIDRGPLLRASRTRVAAAGHRIAPAGALPDPMLSLGVMSVPVPSFDFAAEPMTQLPVGIQQRFPFPGKQGAATAAARADSAGVGAGLVASEAGLAARATEAWFGAALAAAALGYWRDRATLADQAVLTAQVRYETGAAPQTDLLRARLRRAGLEEEHRALISDSSGMGARLRALFGGPTDLPGARALMAPEGPAYEVRAEPLPSLPDLIAQVQAASPELREAAARVERADRAAAVFALAGRPDFTASLQNGVRFGGREPFLTAMLGISLPVWSGRKQGPAAQAARLEADAAREDAEALAARLEGDATALLAELTALRDRVTITTDQTLPLAAAAAASALQRYRVGDVDFGQVLDTQDLLFTTRLQVARLLADYAAARARLAALVGEEWYR